MKFKYFLAPKGAMLGLESLDPWKTGNLSPLPRCSFCDQQAQCFLVPCEEDGQSDDIPFFLGRDINIAELTVLRGNPEHPWEPKFFYRGCMNCLRQGRFTTWHDTEAGIIGADASWEPGGERDEEGEVHPTEADLTFSRTAISELSRTPSFWTYQQALWLTHCDDFMAYVGEWGTDTINTDIVNTSDRNVFESIEQEKPGERWEKLRDSGLYVFKCLHCGKLRSFSDWD